MSDLLIILGISLVLAYCSERKILNISVSNHFTVDLALTAMIVMLSLFCGLRTAYNDTYTYIGLFNNAPTLEEYWADSPNLFGNPLYYWFQSFFHHHISDNYHLFLVIIAFYTITSFILFIRRYSENFVFSILLFFTLGLYLSNFAATKQCIAMATLTYAVPKLLDKKYVQFALIVFIAALWHAYAIMFMILPIFTSRPWSLPIYITIALVIFVLSTFETTISSFLERAEDIGKEISEEEVFETASINLFRLAVFGVPPLLSFLFKGMVNHGISQRKSLMVNMSILSFLIMCLGLASAGNLFGRSAIYFEIGTIVCLPWIINKLFIKNSARQVFQIASVCYLAFFLYDARTFVDEYRAIDFMSFLRMLF